MIVDFSVVIPCYNRAHTLCRAVQSVLTQSYPAWEVIVVDDGSTDHTSKVLESFPQVIYHYQDNGGVCSARNKGAEIATGKWLIFLDSDDELEEDSLIQFSNRVIGNPLTEVIQASYVFVDGKSSILRNVTTGDVGFVSGSFVIKKELFNALGGYDSNLKFGENTELKFRLDKSGTKIDKFDFVAFKYHSATNEGSKNLVNMRYSITYILSKHEDYLSPHVKHLYYQNIGVIELRFQNFELAREYLLKSWKLNPKKMATLLRLIVAFFPKVSKKIYTPEIPL
ncbi:glycosyltransferase family A protein [Algoriphagus confluentis]|uniref:Glycosyltransferase 2-like domain-containing protein n=1 Tax=Algoriphagus confluentis TaxID=1697556 RepID=A0ABQ6PQV9_9BACT|nr:hypothetical protein Aconfl_22160 [Algoriphagus confluentis]